MNRRLFIGSVGMASLCLNGVAQTKPKIRCGILGVAHSHAAAKVRLLQESSEFELIAIAEPAEQIRRNFSDVRWASEEEVLRGTDAIFVQSDVRDHARQALAAVRAGKHVHVEKPPSAKWSEMQEIVAAARERKVLLQSGYMWRYNPGFQAVFEAVRSGWLGEIYQVHGTMSNQLAGERRAEWAEFEGGAFFEQASHLVDAVIRLLGRPRSVKPVLRSLRGDKLVDNNVAVFEFEKAVATISNSTHQPNASAHRSFEVRGTNGTMQLKPIEPPALEVDLEREAGPYKRGFQKISLGEYKRYVGDLADFAQAIRGGKLAASLDDELLVHEWVLRSSGMLD